MRFRKGAKLDPSQVEDYRGQGGGLGGLGGGKILGGGGGLIGVVVLVLYLVIASQGGGGLGDLGSLAGQTVGTGNAQPRARAGVPHGADANEREDCRIVGVVNSVQAYWAKTLRNYEPARTRFFDGQIQTGCGVASSAVGPFYCPADQYVYIDLGSSTP